MATVTVSELRRVFRHNGKDLPDPAPAQSPEKALEILALAHAELNNAVVEPPIAEKGLFVYPVKTSVATKG
jgi:PRTRC genetic system protein C